MDWILGSLLAWCVLAVKFFSALAALARQRFVSAVPTHSKLCLSPLTTPSSAQQKHPQTWDAQIRYVGKIASSAVGLHRAQQNLKHRPIEIPPPAQQCPADTRWNSLDILMSKVHYCACGISLLHMFAAEYSIQRASSDFVKQFFVSNTLARWRQAQTS